MPPKKIPTAPIFGSEKAQALVKGVDTVAGKPVGWWLVLVAGVLFALLLGGGYFLVKRMDALQLEVDKQRTLAFDYVTHDQRDLLEVTRTSNESHEALVAALKQNTAVLERSNIILQNIERKQNQQ